MPRDLHELMRLNADIITVNERTADELHTVAGVTDDPAIADTLRSLARRRRVIAMQMRAQSAAVREYFGEPFRDAYDVP